MTSSSEIPAEILAGVKQALGSSYEHGPIKLVKMTKGTEQEDRILALTQYKSYVLPYTAKTKVEYKFNHLQIDSLESDKPLKLKFGFPKTERERDKSLSLLMKSVNDTLDIIEFILKSLQRVFPMTSMDKLIRRIHLEPADRQSHMEARLHRMSVVEQGPCGGFSHMYRFMCDYFDLPYLAEVAWDVDTIYLSQDCRELRINDFDDLEAKHMLPIIAVLNYNTWFTHLTVVNYKLTSEALKEIPKIILASQTLESLTLDGVGLKWEFLQEMSISLTANTQSILRSINLSNNPIDDRGIRHLCGPLQKMTHGLVELRLVKTGMTAEGASHLGKALGENNFIPTTLKVLDLSGNAFKDAQHGLQNIIGNISRNAKPWADPYAHNLYNFLYQPNNITNLNLADTDCSLNHIFEALHKGCFLSLVHLNLSGTFAHSKHHTAVPRQVKNFFTAARSLKTLNMSRNKCPPSLVREILESIGFNKDLERVEIDLSSNELGQEGADAVSSCISMINNVTTLNLCDNGFNVAMVSLVAWIGQNHSLESIDLSHNMNPNCKKGDREKVVVALEEMIQNPDLPLHTISVANNRFRFETQQLINALGSNTTLLSVDLSGNEMKDIGARLLAKALQINNKLQVVTLDNNSIGFQGFQDLAQAMERNFTLKKMPIPTADMIAAMQKNSEKTEAAIQKIQGCLQRNHSPRKFSNKQAFLLQRGFLYTTAHQMVDKLVVHIEDMATELTQKSDTELQEKISTARGLIDDANNSKKIYDVLQMVVGRSDDEDLTEKLREIACLIESEMESRLERNANGMVDGTAQLCGYVMQNRGLYEKVEDTCREHYKLPPRFVEDLVDQISAETSNQCSEANLAMASFISDSILDEIIEQLSTVEAELSDELKKFRDEVANGTTVRQVDSMYDSQDGDEEEAENDEEEKDEEEIEKDVEDESSEDRPATNEGALPNGSLEESGQDEAVGASGGVKFNPLAGPPPMMTKKQNIRVQRHKSIKRPASQFQPEVLHVDLDKPDDLKDIPNLPDPHDDVDAPVKLTPKLPSLPQKNDPPKLPSMPKKNDPPKLPSTPQKNDPPKLRRPPPGPSPKLTNSDFDTLSNQATQPLKDLRADRPRVSRAIRPDRPRRPGNPNVIQEDAQDDLSAMFDSPVIDAFVPTVSPSASPSGSQANLANPKKSDKKKLFGGIFSSKSKGSNEPKESRKEKKEREEREKKEKKEREKKEKEKKEKEEKERRSKKKEKALTPASSSSSSSYKSEPAIDDPDRASKLEPKSPRLPEISSTPDPIREGKEETTRETTGTPSKSDVTEGTDQSEEKPPTVSPKATPRAALRPMTGGISLLGADVMKQMQERRTLQPSNNESLMETPEPKSPTTSPKPAFRSSPPSSENVAHRPMVLPTSPLRSIPSSNQSPLVSPVSPNTLSPGPTSPRPTSTSPKPTPIARPIPKPRKSELPLGAASLDIKPVKEVKEEEEKEKKKEEEAARSSSVKSTSSTPGEKTESDAAKVDNEEQPPPAEGKADPKPKEAAAAEQTKSEPDEMVPTEKREEKAEVKESVLNNTDENLTDTKEDKPKEEKEDDHKEEKLGEISQKTVEPKATPEKEEKLTPNAGKQESPNVDVSGGKADEINETKTPESTPKESLVRTGSTSSDKSSPLTSSGPQKESGKKSEPVPMPKRDSTKSSSPPTAPRTPSTDSSPKRQSSRPKPAVSVRPHSISRKPVLPPNTEGGIAAHRQSLKPVTPKKPDVKDRASHIHVGLNLGPKDSNGETGDIISRKPSDIKKASKASVNGQTPKDTTLTDTPVKEENEEAKDKEAIFV